MFEGTAPDIALHIVTVLVAAGLFTVSYKAYVKKQNKKFLYICMAFAVFAVKELLIALDTLYFSNPATVAGVHLLNLAILALFFRGTVK
ncbi:MAG: hypothetical protein ABEK04_01210 [Candidatus Nanohalobium sp.]